MSNDCAAQMSSASITHMRRIFITVFTLLLIPSIASANEPLSAEEFDRYTQGKTLFYGNVGEVYGVERYLPNRRVIWSFLDGRCQEGRWYQEGDNICFVYEDVPTPQCWRFEQGSNGLSAQFEGSNGTTELYEKAEIDQDMICQGPDVGV